MKLSDLKALSTYQCREMLRTGKLTAFECMFHDYLNRDIDWPKFAAEDIVRVRQQLNLTQEGLAELLKVSPKTVLRWETQGEDVPNTVNIALCVISKLGKDVFALMASDRKHFRLVVDEDSDEAITDGVDDPRYNLRAKIAFDQVPENFDAERVAELRARLRMNRREFAEFLGISLSTAVNWENGSVVPKGSSLALLKALWIHGRKAFSLT